MNRRWLNRALRCDDLERRLSPSGIAAGEAEMAFTAEFRDNSGNELIRDSNGRFIVTPGAVFQMYVYADDLRDVTQGGGVFSGFVSATAHALATEITFVGPVDFGPGFGLGQNGTVHATSLSQVGALRDDLTPPGSDPSQLLFQVEVRVGSGLADGHILSVTLSSGTSPPTNRNLLFGSETDVESSFQGTEIAVVVHPWQNRRDAADVNDDGRISTRDLMHLVNAILRANGPLELGLPTVTQIPWFFYDPVADGVCDLADIHFVIDRIMEMRAAMPASSAIFADD